MYTQSAIVHTWTPFVSHYVNCRGLTSVKKLGWMNVKERYFYFQTLLIFKSIHDLAPHYLVNNVIMEIEIKEQKTRKHDMDLYLPFPENESHKKMLMYRGARSWNSLPNYLKETYNIDQFKKLLKVYIKNAAH